MEEKIVKLESPIDDHALEFNKDTGRYQLTLEEAKTLFDVFPIKSDAVAKRRIKECSRLVYNYILGRCYTGNRTLVNYLLNNTENGRRFLKEVLSLQVEADFTTGINSLGKMPAINMSTGHVIDRNMIKENQLCVAAADEIAQSQNYFCGINLMLQCPYPYSVYNFVGMN